MRSILLIASALGAGLALGRKYLERGVTAQKHKAIQDAAIETRRRVKRHAHDFLRKSFRRFAIATGCKLVILGVLWTLYHTQLIEVDIFALITGVVLALFLMRDLWISWPFIRLGAAELSKYGWRPRRALSEVVAARVFEEVLTEARATPASRSTKVVLMLAGQSHEGVHLEIATAVAAIARDTTWNDLRPFLISAGIKMAALTLIYSISVIFLMA
ncbi:hypothetical protein [Hyphomonas pacifica]|uniref:Uncharacterized protein n=1 Tax=Hyphomonas pacifica TaxID=1280941 RepID=A0A062TW41_9PROT|nr:hypothetical protein [Hyphomonas pacifica]KCZ52246.1 hypothetical protein HY2_09520 [Hyphomonas pacifica]RAN35100.1 hypothetical protein HY3_09650 [Hyphomonas pacifica]